MGRQKRSNHVYDALKQAIVAGTYQAGSLLPREFDLAEQLHISRGTLRVALDQLESEHFIERVKRLGTVVLPNQGKLPKLLVITGPSKNLAATTPSIMPGIQYEAMRHSIACDQIDLAFIQSLSIDSAVKSIMDRGTSGVLLLATFFTGHEPILRILKQTDLPVILPHASPGDLEITGFNMIMHSDLREAMRMGFNYLAENGHRRVAYLGELEWRGYPVLDDYCRDLEKAGLEPDKKLTAIVTTDDEAGIEREIDRLLRLSAPPTAIYCASDMFALLAYRALQKRRVRIPKDISVMAIGGNIGGDYLSPRLTVVDFNYFDIGKTAVENMLRLLNGASDMPKIQITPSSMTVRESCLDISRPVSHKTGKRAMANVYNQ